MPAESDDLLVRYLLGNLPDDEAERLDERSITDDALALRLRVVEDDLIDRYARGETFDAALERFDGIYQRSPYLREKVRFAQALSSLTAKAEPRRTPVRIRPAPSRIARLSLAAAAVLVLAVAGYLGFLNNRLRDEVGQLQTRRAEVERRNAELQQQLERTPATPTGQLSPATATFLLRPPRRSLRNDTAIVSLPRGTEQVTLRLQVESDDYAVFWAALRDPASSRIVWRSGDLTAEAGATDRIVAFTVPVKAFGAPGAPRYTVELSGISPGGSAELVSHYLIHVVLE